MATITPEEMSSPRQALPFWLSLGTVPVAFVAMGLGGVFVLLLPLYAWGLFSVLDAIAGLNEDNAIWKPPRRSFTFTLCCHHDLVSDPVRRPVLHAVVRAAGGASEHR